MKVWLSMAFLPALSVIGERGRGLNDEQVKEMLVLSSLATNSAPPMPQQRIEVADEDEAARPRKIAKVSHSPAAL